MFRFLKRKNSDSSAPESSNHAIDDDFVEVIETSETNEVTLDEPATSSEHEAESPSPAPTEAKSSWFTRLRQGLRKTRQQFGAGLGRIILGKKVIDEDLLEELETQLLMADVGVEATTDIMKTLVDKVARRQLADPEALLSALKQCLLDLLQPCEQPLQLPNARPAVLLMVGVNGAGKTTTIGKLSKRFQTEGKKVLLAAGDTFRAAAVEQLQAWGERHHIPVIAQHTGADSASVIYDGLQAARARKADVFIADTAGRLHTQHHLMAELQKIKRVLAKLDPEAPHETVLVLDASAGQNALHQAKQFHHAIGVDSVILTKLDGSAKGGIIFAVAAQLNLPIRFIGIGEQAEDLRVFEAKAFVEALFNESDETRDE